MIHDIIRMRFLGVPVATITIRVTVEREERWGRQMWL
jgi:hypothetical protein